MVLYMHNTQVLIALYLYDYCILAHIIPCGDYEREEHIHQRVVPRLPVRTVGFRTTTYVALILLWDNNC